MLREIPCAVCKASGNFTILYPKNFQPDSFTREIFSARRKPDRVHYQIVRCRRCGLVYSNPILAAENIHELYHQSHFTYQDKIEDLNRTYGSYLQRTLPYAGGRERLLEIGCGNGFFLAHAKTLGVANVYGVEPSTEAVAQAEPELRPRITQSVFQTGLFPSGHFNLICAFQVLDHVVDPNRFLRLCYDYLKPGGAMLCICHNISAMMAKLLGEKCPMIDIEHIYLFNRQTLPRIYQQNGFRLASVFAVKNTYPLSYWLSLLPVPGGMRRVLTAGLSKLGLLERRLTLRAGNQGIIAVKP